ncbi:MAG: tetratricopeptide repeat protein [Bacteroidia bacterium]|nr:tetratricopeptide repeat protein [Bacteroidia bacterium]
MKHGLLLLFILICSSGFSQTGNDELLAAQYYQNKEYDKALIYYEKLYQKKDNQAYYKYYVDCLIETKAYKEAEKVIRKRIKAEPGSLYYYVDLGLVYLRAGEETKAKEQFEKAISQLSEENNQVFVVAKSFLAIREYDLAIKTYEKGRKLMKGSYPFNFEIAQVYGQKGEYPSMIGEILDVLLINISYKQSVEDALAPFLEDGTGNKRVDLVRTELLKRTQKFPDKIIFSEMLIWLLIQQREFEAAFTQVKALDKRLKEEGQRVMELGTVCAGNEMYETAIHCYQYVLNKGNNGSFYIAARQELLNVMYKKVVGRNDYTPADLMELEKNYQIALEELGKSSATIFLIRNLAHIQAFYLNKLDEPISLLNDALMMGGLTPGAEAECKLELADILLLKGEIWDASLMYSQVEKAMKHDVLGHEAKYRNARLSYYIGDFKWAQAQLDALKGATSKLISNDAMDLSLLISDNSTLDTNLVPLIMFARADLLFFRNNFDLSLSTLDSIRTLFPGHMLTDEILFKKYQIAMRRGKWQEAAGFLQLILKDHSFDIYADDACFKLGDLYEHQLYDPDKAREYYEQVLLKFPNSLFSVEARKRYRRLRGDGMN